MTTALESPPKDEREAAAAVLGPLDEPGIKFSPLGLQIDPSVKYEQWAQYGRKLSLVKKGLQWAIGDWINHGEKAYGEKYAQAVAETGLAEETLMNYASVARAFKTSRRREVSFSTHAEVMGLEEKDQDAILTEAEKNKTPREKVRRMVSRIKIEKGPKPDETELIYSADERAFLDEYGKALDVLDDCAPSVPALRYMNHAHHGHVLWQKDRTIGSDCEAIRDTVVKSGGTIDESDLFIRLHERGYFMSDPEFEDRLTYMNRDDVRLALVTDAGEEGRQENRRGKLPSIVCVPWRKVWNQRQRDEDDDDKD